jgi:hypothetical protein
LYGLIAWQPAWAWAWLAASVPVGGNYGRHEVLVSTQQAWINSGLWVALGQTFSVQLNPGLWEQSGHPECASGIWFQVGMAFKARPRCLVVQQVQRALRSGIVYFTAQPFTAHGRRKARLTKPVSVTVMVVSASGQTAPTLDLDALIVADFNQSHSGWVEVYDGHIVLTLPVSELRQNILALWAALRRLNQFYAAYADLFSDRMLAVPPMVRLSPVASLPSPISMVAGFPIRFLTSELDTLGAGFWALGYESEPKYWWGYAHEIAHMFQQPWEIWPHPEAWPNLLVAYAQEQLGLALRPAQQQCQAIQLPLGQRLQMQALATKLRSSPWLSLCYLQQMVDAYGWAVFRRYAGLVLKPSSRAGGQNLAELHQVLQHLSQTQAVSNEHRFER